MAERCVGASIAGRGSWRKVRRRCGWLRWQAISCMFSLSLPSSRWHYRLVSNRWNLWWWPLLLLLAGTGCQTPRESSMPLDTVTVADSPEVAPAGPISITNAEQTVSVPLNSASTRRWPEEWNTGWIPLESWGRFNGLGKPLLLGINPHPTYQYQSSNGWVVLKLGTRLARCNGLECWLGYAPQMIRGQPCLHYLDAKKTLQPLMDPLFPIVRENRTVVIDPGHGGRDGGARCAVSSLYEKDYTLDWALRLASLLATNHWRVILTRSQDLEVSLPERVSISDRAQADLFVSLHFNSGVTIRELSGLETYCLTPAGLPSSLLRVAEDDPSQVYPNNTFDEQNFQWALRLHQAVVHYTAGPDRGLRRARFMAVLRGQRRPAVLVEGGYLSNPAEAARIIQPEYRQKLAEAVAHALR